MYLSFAVAIVVVVLLVYISVIALQIQDLLKRMYLSLMKNIIFVGRFELSDKLKIRKFYLSDTKTTFHPELCDCIFRLPLVSSILHHFRTMFDSLDIL